MTPTPYPTASDYLRDVLADERARLRELSACIVERLRQEVEMMDGVIPPALVEIVGVSLLRQAFDSSDRIEALGVALDYEARS